MSATATPELRVQAPPVPRAASRWQAATRAEIAVLITYFVLVVGLTDILNVRLGVEFLTPMVLIAAALITRRLGQFVRDWWFFLVALFLWSLTGPIAAASPFPVHYEFMLRADTALGLGNDPAEVLQHALTAGTHVNTLDVLTAIAYNLHLPELYIASYVLWRIDRSVFSLFSTALVLLLALGLVTFILFPAAPPWVLSQWWHVLPPDVPNRFGLVLRAHPMSFRGTPLVYYLHLTGDAVAAVPSEHAAVPLLEMLAFGLALGRRAYIGFGLWVLWVLFSIVYLGEHWVTDALIGYLYGGVIFAGVLGWLSHGGRALVPPGYVAPNLATTSDRRPR